VGQVYGGRYRLVKELGSGGFATVYFAVDEKLVQKPVVVKVLDNVRSDAWAKRKFHQEIEALARIDHPGVVSVLDEGQTPSGTPFLVMQYIDGVTLRKLIPQGGMDLALAGEILRQVGSALGAAHDRGVYHRDLKPENIMVQSADSEPRVKLIDFGIAGIKDSVFSQSEQSTRIAGTYRYMPPEQLEGKVCPESDIFALGAIAYEMLTGEPAIGSPMELIAIRYDGLKVKPRQRRPELPEAAEAVIVRALSYDAGDRYQTAREVGDRLAAALMPSRNALTDTVKPEEVPEPAAPIPSDRLEIAHVLFLDAVGFSTLPMEEQRTLLEKLQKLVRATPHFASAEKAGDLIALPTGDGMALVFFGNPIPAAECALEIARATRDNPGIRLRTGLHSGPVYRVADINKNLNVTGGGINMAQRVMDAGDAGHILVSATAAETLRQFTGWGARLSDLGEHQVKHGETIHFFNLCTEDAGNPALPSKWAKAPVAEPAKSRRGLISAAAVGTVAAALALGGIWLGTRTKPPGAPPASKADVVTPPPVVQSELEYSLTVQPTNGESFQLAGEMLFPAGYQVALTMRAPKPGFLYVLDDGPMPDDGSIVISMGYPGAGKRAEVPAGQAVRIPPRGWFLLDKAQGSEKVYLVWSASPVPEMEAVKDRKDLLVKGQVVIRDTTALRQFLTSNTLAETGIKRDPDAKKTLLSSDRPILVHLIRLEHH
jgi:serine/threonine protein kinase